MPTDKEKMRTMTKTRGDPLLFVTDVLGATPSEKQREALEAVRDGQRKIAIRAAHDQGKTTLEAWLALWALVHHMPCKVVVAGNSSDQLRDVVHPEIVRWSRNLPEAIRALYEFGLERIYMIGAADETFITFRTANKSNPEALQGFHSANLFFFIEEASGIPDIVFEIAEGAMSSKGSFALMIANPTQTQGYFAKAFKQNRWAWHCLHWPWVPNPWSDPAYPENMAKTHGENSNVYRVRVLGEFPTSDDNAVIPLAAIERSVGRDDIVGSGARSRVWGLDIARFGDDRCALVKRWGSVIKEKTRWWWHKDLMQTVGIVAKEYFQTPEGDRPSAINCDVIGLGAGVVDRLAELGLPVFGTNVAESAETPELYMRRRDELWWLAREWFLSNAVTMPDDPDLISDLSAPTYKMVSNGKIEVEKKDDMKKRGLKSPDLADALCLTFAGGEFAGAMARQTQGDPGIGNSLDGGRYYRPNRTIDDDVAPMQTHGMP